MSTRMIVRRYRAILRNDQYDKLSAANTAQDDYFNFSLDYLYKVYGVKSDRTFPDLLELKRVIKNEIRDAYLKKKELEESKKTGKVRWSTKDIGMSSQQGEAMISNLLTNFGEYWKVMDRRRRVFTEDEKREYAKKFGRAYYAKGRIKRRDSNSKPMSVVTPSNGGQVVITSPHHIKVPHFGVVQVREWINHHKNDSIQQVGLKLIKAPSNRNPAIVEIQLVIKVDIPKKVSPNKEVGLDWGMLNDGVYTTDSGRVFQIPTNVTSQVSRLDKEARLLQSKLSTLSPSRAKGLSERYSYLRAKQSNIVDEYYFKLAHELCDQYDLIAIEDLDPFKMRKGGGGSAKDRGFNRKLATNKPRRLAEILTWVAQSRGVTLLRVDPHLTSQVEFGQHPSTATKHDLSERSWISPYTGQLVDRDVNAAKNILDWAKNPTNHPRHILDGREPDSLVQSF